MGQILTSTRVFFVSFGPREEGFRAYIPLEAAFASSGELEVSMSQASTVYKRAIETILLRVEQIKLDRKSRKTISARRIWTIGNIIFKLLENLKRKGFEIDGVYDHFVRDIKVKKKWLEKVIILRRYVPDKMMIPNSLSWGQLEKGTGKKAKKLRIEFENY